MMMRPTNRGKRRRGRENVCREVGRGREIQQSNIGVVGTCLSPHKKGEELQVAAGVAQRDRSREGGTYTPIQKRKEKVSGSAARQGQPKSRGRRAGEKVHVGR